MHNSFIICVIREIRGFYFPFQHQNTRCAGVWNWILENDRRKVTVRVNGQTKMIESNIP
jgi:hypothetical protein